jgi:hemolysin type calcium-binding protein
VIRGTEGADKINGAGGSDRLYGNGGGDVVRGGFGDDPAVRGDEGADRLQGNLGDDNLYGGSGNDKLGGGAGRDLLEGQAGNDQLFASGDSTRDQVNCGNGNRDFARVNVNDVVDGDPVGSLLDAPGSVISALSCERIQVVVLGDVDPIISTDPVGVDLNGLGTPGDGGGLGGGLGGGILGGGLGGLDLNL